MLTALKAGTRYSIIQGVLQASLMEGAFLVPALPPYIIEPIWEQLRALLPQREVNPSARLPQATNLRPGSLREAGASISLRLRLPQDRR